MKTYEDLSQMADEVEAESAFEMDEAGRHLAEGRAWLATAKRSQARAKMLREKAERAHREQV